MLLWHLQVCCHLGLLVENILLLRKKYYLMVNYRSILKESAVRLRCTRGLFERRSLCQKKFFVFFMYLNAKPALPKCPPTMFRHDNKPHWFFCLWARWKNVWLYSRCGLNILASSAVQHMCSISFMKQFSAKTTCCEKPNHINFYIVWMLKQMYLQNEMFLWMFYLPNWHYSNIIHSDGRFSDILEYCCL